MGRQSNYDYDRIDNWSFQIDPRLSEDEARDVQQRMQSGPIEHFVKYFKADPEQGQDHTENQEYPYLWTVVMGTADDEDEIRRFLSHFPEVIAVWAEYREIDQDYLRADDLHRMFP